MRYNIRQKIYKHIQNKYKNFSLQDIRELLQDHNFRIEKITSDIVKIWKSKYKRLAEILPSLGLHIIAIARNIK